MRSPPTQEGIKLQVSGALKSEKDILAVNFAVGDRIIRLADIAQVRREDADPPDPIFRINGKPGLGLSISMRDGGDVLALGRNIQQTMQELKADLPIGIEPIMVANQPETVSKSINEFMEALWEAIAIVLAVSVVSLGLRAGAIVIVSIPLVLAVVFAAMQALGIDLQRISLGALIIALGLLVDDAMITIESMVIRLERGDNKQQAAVFAYASTAMPRLTGTLVTIAGFLPVGFARSDAGEYTFSLFAVVALALLASWVVSGLFAPVVGVALLRPPKHPHGETLGAPMRLFRRCLLAAMRAKWITIADHGWSVRRGPRRRPVSCRSSSFPASDRPELLVDLKLQDNASILATRDVVRQFDKIVAADPDVERFSTYVGQGAIRFYLPLDVALPNDFFAQSVVVTKGLEEREQVRARLEKALATRFPQVVARVYPLELGPPVGWPVKYRVSGPDLARVRSIALQVADLLGDDGGRAQRQLRLGRTGAGHAHPHRPGPGETAWPQFAGRGNRAERRRDRHHGDAGARQHLPDRRGRARRTGHSAPRLNRFARCRSRCPAVAWFRCGRSPASITPRNIRSSGGATASRP